MKYLIQIGLALLSCNFLLAVCEFSWNSNEFRPFSHCSKDGSARKTIQLGELLLINGKLVPIFCEFEGLQVDPRRNALGAFWRLSIFESKIYPTSQYEMQCILPNGDLINLYGRRDGRKVNYSSTQGWNGVLEDESEVFVMRRDCGIQLEYKRGVLKTTDFGDGSPLLRIFADESLRRGQIVQGGEVLLESNVTSEPRGGRLISIESNSYSSPLVLKIEKFHVVAQGLGVIECLTEVSRTGFATLSNKKINYNFDHSENAIMRVSEGGVVTGIEWSLVDGKLIREELKADEYVSNSWNYTLSTRGESRGAYDIVRKSEDGKIDSWFASASGVKTITQNGSKAEIVREVGRGGGASGKLLSKVYKTREGVDRIDYSYNSSGVLVRTLRNSTELTKYDIKQNVVSSFDRDGQLRWAKGFNDRGMLENMKFADGSILRIEYLYDRRLLLTYEKGEVKTQRVIDELFFP